MKDIRLKQKNSMLQSVNEMQSVQNEKQLQQSILQRRFRHDLVKHMGL